MDWLTDMLTGWVAGRVCGYLVCSRYEQLVRKYEQLVRNSSGGL